MTAIAFKEWASVCQALGSGRQTIILRKGGIHEGREGFRVQYRQFWLLPTLFHQSADDLVPDALPLLAAAQSQQPLRGLLSLSLFAAVHEVVELHHESQALALAPYHVWSANTVRQRFGYRQPGLYLLGVRVWRAPQPHSIVETPAMAGCRSWVELPEELSPEGLQPVLPDAGFDDRWREIQTLVRASVDTP